MRPPHLLSLFISSSSAFSPVHLLRSIRRSLKNSQLGSNGGSNLLVKCKKKGWAHGKKNLERESDEFNNDESGFDAKMIFLVMKKFESVMVSFFDKTKAKLTEYVPSACEISFKDSSAIRYATRVKGILMRGKLTSIEGMKTKVLVWVKVTSVAVESYKSDKVWFTVGVKKSRAQDAYLLPQDAVRVQEF